MVDSGPKVILGSWGGCEAERYWGMKTYCLGQEYRRWLEGYVVVMPVSILFRLIFSIFTGTLLICVDRSKSPSSYSFSSSNSSQNSWEFGPRTGDCLNAYYAIEVSFSFLCPGYSFSLLAVSWLECEREPLSLELFGSIWISFSWR